MRILLPLLALILLSSCIPTNIAPRFKNKDYKIMQAKKFSRKLPKKTSFIFKDPKDANEFYHYINTKLRLNHSNVGYNSPFYINKERYYLSYEEVGKEDKVFNIGIAATDLVLQEKTGLTVFDDNYTSRTGHWYIVITVFDEQTENCLLDTHPKKDLVIEYLKAMKKEYLETHNYQELLFTKKS